PGGGGLADGAPVGLRLLEIPARPRPAPDPDLRQHRTIWQEHSAKDFASYESYKRAGILYVFPPFITARMGQKIGRRPQTQLCGAALNPFRLASPMTGRRNEAVSLDKLLYSV